MGRIFASVKKRKCKITVIGKVDESLLLLECRWLANVYIIHTNKLINV